jgi:hypothetical protein
MIPGSTRVSRIGEPPRDRELRFTPPGVKLSLREKFVSARRRNQHARRARSPENALATRRLIGHLER